ncbi:hypothetical protein M405DRAFT_826510 [Rhizopogon salebrosus TDB-379]|nr:hypothetical protein M405DRAFT_826510 [Rhizopogon salebrosus TDB-379]
MSGMPSLRSFATNTTCSSNTLSLILSITPRHWKNRGRGGQNLTERYRRLENTLRGKDTFIKRISELSQEVDDASKARSPLSMPPSPPDVQMAPEIIAGFMVPREPTPPADEECCMSGCAICIYDLYEESLEAYKESLAALRSSLSALSIPESEWPERIRTTAKIPAVEKRQDAILSAFEEMERQLKEKRERRAVVEAES